MIPKEKAKDLIDKMWIYALPNANGSFKNAKQCALIAVDVIIFELKIRNCSIKYFEEVKQEIEKL